jgi:hypothetical protein
VGELERDGRKQDEKTGRSNPYLYLAMGLGFAIAAVMVISTAQVLAAGIGFVIPAAVLLGLGVNELQKQRSALPKPASKERELLSAIRENGGSITPAEAAMETSLTVREADEMLSELAGGGHLMVEGRNGALFYSLPNSRTPKLESPGETG